MTPRLHSLTHTLRLQWLVLLAAWLLLGTLLGVFLWEDRQGVLQREQERLQKQGQVLHDYVGQQLAAIAQALDHVRSEQVTRVPSTAGLRRLDERLQSLTDSSQMLHVLHFIDLQGQVLASSLPEHVGQPFPRLVHFQDA
ncbi:TPA: hypothetical protein ACQJWO_005768, partial [Klebsiella pneumoniae]